MDYLTACLLLGIGIAVDVTLATLAMYPRFKTVGHGYSWISKVTSTHIIFPMIGYYGFAYVYRVFPHLNLVLGIVAAIAIFWFLFSAFKGLHETDLPDLGSYKEISWIMVLGVSWDALWSGPAKSAQAVGWSYLEVFWSFIIAGGVVACFAYVSVVIAVKMNTMDSSRLGDNFRRAQRETVAAWLEFTVIGYFGFLAINRYIFHSNWPGMSLLALSGVLWLFLFSLRWRPLVSARFGKYI